MVKDLLYNVFGESTILGDASCVEVLTENSLSTPTIETSVALGTRR